MRILFLAHRAPWPPNKGEKLRSYHQIRLLSREHDIDLFCLADRSDEIDDSDLPRLCRSVRLYPRSHIARLAGTLRAAIDGRSLTVGHFDCPHMRRAVEQANRSERYDLVFASTAAVAPFARLVSAPRVIDLMDVDSRKWQELARLSPMRRPVYGLEARRMRRCERDLAADFDAAFLVNENERRFLEKIAPGLPSFVISNGTETEQELPIRSKTAHPSIVFVGTMSYRPNIDAVHHFCHQILPTVRECHPAVRFTIVGRDPDPAVQRLARLPGVTVTGTVPDVGPYLAEAWIFVAPHRSAPGLQNKILEAMNAGLPVVCSQACFDGLSDGDFRPERDLLVGREPRELATAIDRLILDGDLRSHLGRGGQSRAREGYRWDRVSEQLERVLAQLLERKGPRGSRPPALTAVAM